ncbi:MAG: protein kinase [Kofleriaceae bacterium]|nr:protein kinase [Kofleriaceae bacterium]
MDRKFDPAFDGDGAAVEFDDQKSAMAMGTHDSKPRDGAAAGGYAADDPTKVSTPLARVRTPLPSSASSKAAPTGTKPPPFKVEKKIDVEGDSNLGATLGSYRVVEILGKGGMGYVYRAEHVRLGREVALKLLRPDYSKRRDAVARFFQEARTVNRVRHRNIVDVTDFVELEDGTTFIIMELLRGTSLGRWSRTKVDLPRALTVLVQICDGLAAAHAVGVIHRDLKPDNIFVEPAPDGTEVAKLLDFGVAKLLNRDDEDVGFQTAAGSVIGTPAYMSPEQAGGMAIDGRSDIYSLGAIMYELFTGQTMFRGRSFGEYVRKHLSELPVMPHKTPGGATIDLRIESIILRCVEKEPARRFTDALELRDALLNVLAGFETQPPVAVATLLRPGAGAEAPFGAVPGSAVSLGSLGFAGVPTFGAAVDPGVPAVPTAALAYPGENGTMQLSQSALQSVSSHYSVLTPSQVSYSSQLSHVSLHRPKSSPWPWIIAFGMVAGAAVGVGLYAMSGDSGSDNQAMSVTGASPGSAAVSVTAVPGNPTRPIEVRFEATPSGGVYVEGGSVELCHTPCSLSIDVADGGSTSTRTFMIRAEGRVDQPVLVDVSPVGRREYAVQLAEKTSMGTPSTDSNGHAGHDGPAERVGSAGSGSGGSAATVGNGSGGKRPRPTKAEIKPELKPEIKPELKPEIKPDAPNVIPDTLPAKVEPKPPQNPTRISPSDTIDPFKPR